MLFSSDVVSAIALLSFAAGALTAICAIYLLSAHSGKHNIDKKDEE